MEAASCPKLEPGGYCRTFTEVNWLTLIWKTITAGVVESRAESDLAANMFTPRARHVLALAKKEATRLHHKEVTTEHVLMALIELRRSVAWNVLRKRGLDLEKLCPELLKRMGGAASGPEASREPSYAVRVKKVLALAIKEAKALKEMYVGSEHILLGILAEGNSLAAKTLLELGIDLQTMRQDVQKEFLPDFDVAQ
jgi:ATP-dependent Clp protease ATP-binding subunit ClpC